MTGGNADPTLLPRPDVLKVNSAELMDMSHALGPEGRGFYELQARVDSDLILKIEKGLAVAEGFWAKAPDMEKPDGEIVIQNFESFDINFHNGSDSYKEVFPEVEILRTRIDDLAHELDLYLPGLSEWNSHSVYFQRYPPEVGKLDWHRDLSRHPQVVFVVCVKGGGALVFDTVDVSGQPAEEKIATEPGKVIIMRAPYVWPGADASCRVRHRAENKDDEERITATFRDDLKPNEPLPGANTINAN